MNKISCYRPETHLQNSGPVIQTARPEHILIVVVVVVFINGLKPCQAYRH